MNKYDTIDNKKRIKPTILTVWGEGKELLINSWWDVSHYDFLESSLELKSYIDLLYIRFNNYLDLTDLVNKLRDKQVIVYLDLKRYELVEGVSITDSVPLLLNKLSSVIKIQGYSTEDFYDFKEGELCKI